MNPVLDAFHIPLAASETQRAERVLACARSFLAVGCVVAIYFDPMVPIRYRTVAHACAFFYVVYSLAVLAFTHAQADSDRAFVLAVHSADVVWAAAIAMLTSGPNAPPFVLFLFALLAAAYRWGFWHTLGTALATTSLLVLGSVGVRWSPYWRSADAAIGRGNLITGIACLFMIGGLFGYLAGKEKLQRKRTLTIERLVTKVDPEVSIRETVGQVLGSFMGLFGSPRILLALHETVSDRAFFWEATAGGGLVDANLRSCELKDSERNRYLFAAPGQSWCGVRLRRPRHDQAFRLLVLGSGGERLHNVPCSFPESFFARHSFRSLLAVAFTLNGDWSGRLFLLDPGAGFDRAADLRFLQALVQEVAPALHSIYLLRRLRSRVRAAERARIARELHDEVFQSLIAAEMRVELLRRKAVQTSSGITEELSQVQKLLHQEVLCVRGLMQKMRSLEVRPEELLASFADIVERFRRETGIAAQLVAEPERVALPPSVCGEMARIVQEALVNVRKHSGAHNVLVRFASDHGLCKLVVEDDGRGFEFSGRFSQSDLEHLHKGPRVLQERVRSIRGELNIESVPGRGARLEICVPQKTYG